MRILQVEMNADVVQLLGRAFKELGTPVTIEVVTSGARAIEHLHLCVRDRLRALPDVIVFDVNLPVMNGLSLLRLLQRHPEWNRIQVLVLTSSLRDDERTQVMLLGAVGYFVKPSQYDEYLGLAQRIQRIPNLGQADASETPAAEG